MHDSLTSFALTYRSDIFFVNSFFAKRQNLIFLELIFARLNCISKFMSNTMKVVTVPIEILEQND